MKIDWVNFTPWHSLAGGVLIGIATLILILANGRIAGISGISGSLFKPQKNDVLWRVMFIAGLVISSWIYRLFAPLPLIQFEQYWYLLITAGFLVGVGTRLGSGCTSGHGVCGLSRQSPRSLVATLVFICTGMGTVFVLRHVLGVN